MVQVQSLIEAGVHFGHRVSRWHPRMKPFIFGKRNLIHIIDIRETIKGLVRASNFLAQMAAVGKDVVFIGTKRQAKSLIQREAQRCGMHYVSERWLGGTLTNYHTIRSRLRRLEELEELEKSGAIEHYSKKRISSLRRERRKITRNLEGIRNMKQLPGCLVVVDIRREYISVKEARKIGIPVVGLVDTDCDPREVDIVIPGNDDAYRAIQQVLRVLADSVIQGRDKYVTTQAEIEKSRLEEEARKKEAEAKVAKPAIAGQAPGGEPPPAAQPAAG
jgi:small subunit ribosomal protein S2